MDGLTLTEKMRLLVIDYWNSLFYTGIMDVLFNQTSTGCQDTTTYASGLTYHFDKDWS